jgi:hypothetical protein
VLEVRFVRGAAGTMRILTIRGSEPGQPTRTAFRSPWQNGGATPLSQLLSMAEALSRLTPNLGQASELAQLFRSTALPASSASSQYFK